MGKVEVDLFLAHVLVGIIQFCKGLWQRLSQRLNRVHNCARLPLLCHLCQRCLLNPDNVGRNFWYGKVVALECKHLFHAFCLWKSHDFRWDDVRVVGCPSCKEASDLWRARGVNGVDKIAELTKDYDVLERELCGAYEELKNVQEELELSQKKGNYLALLMNKNIDLRNHVICKLVRESNDLKRKLDHSDEEIMSDYGEVVRQMAEDWEYVGDTYLPDLASELSSDKPSENTDDEELITSRSTSNAKKGRNEIPVGAEEEIMEVNGMMQELMKQLSHSKYEVGEVVGGGLSFEQYLSAGEEEDSEESNLDGESVGTSEDGEEEEECDDGSSLAISSTEGSNEEDSESDKLLSLCRRDLRRSTTEKIMWKIAVRLANEILVGFKTFVKGQAEITEENKGNDTMHLNADAPDASDPPANSEKNDRRFLLFLKGCQSVNTQFLDILRAYSGLDGHNSEVGSEQGENEDEESADENAEESADHSSDNSDDSSENILRDLDLQISAKKEVVLAEVEAVVNEMNQQRRELLAMAKRIWKLPEWFGDLEVKLVLKNEDKLAVVEKLVSRKISEDEFLAQSGGLNGLEDEAVGN